MTAELILYACPSGPLAAQLDRYFEAAKAAFSWNPANDYMPHCTLTGFFRDAEAAIPAYIAAIESAVQRNKPTLPSPVMRVTGFLFQEDFHGLTLSSNWLLRVTSEFAAAAPCVSRTDPLRLKHWLHLSLAYQFPKTEHRPRTALAHSKVATDASVRWRLCLYQRFPDRTWTRHGLWPLDPLKERASQCR